MNSMTPARMTRTYRGPFHESKSPLSFHVCFHVCFSASLETYSTEGSGAVIDEAPIGEAGDALQVSFQI